MSFLSSDFNVLFVNTQKILNSNDVIVEMDKGVETTMSSITEIDIIIDKMKGT